MNNPAHSSLALPVQGPRVEGRTVRLATGDAFEADVVLWGTGYEMDLSYLEPAGVAGIRRPDQLARRCGSMVMSLDAPNLYFISVGLDSTSASPWHYAHLARTIISAICGKAKLGREPVAKHLNYIRVPMLLAQFDPANYPPDRWTIEYAALLETHPNDQPMPISVLREAH